MNLVYLDGKKEPYTLSSIIAECADIKHHTVTRLLRDHKKDFEHFGVLGFQIHKPNKETLGGRPTKDYQLNEQQATLLITYLRNTEPVKQFKSDLVKAFFEMREELTQIRLQRSLEAPKRKTLNEAIKTWEHAPKMAYPTVYNLLLKAVTGKNSKQLKTTRGAQSGIDCLNSIELAQYTALEDMVIALINLNFTYHDIKTIVLNKTLRCA
ncbi:Rha family transcriptional regulator [Streptococcus uberis]|uniref:Rha family transcriptional regulator n=1 Tax=Streptococcus uberis TaxID=1349 RepID=UPI001FF34B72|nr:Rha family transcriptional regulator [Streptococcus uberis]MCK1231615.1 Rha family transcriptional regulator [Streptococcus uberis]